VPQNPRSAELETQADALRRASDLESSFLSNTGIGIPPGDRERVFAGSTFVLRLPRRPAGPAPEGAGVHAATRV
jgi:hypothetical protein